MARRGSFMPRPMVLTLLTAAVLAQGPFSTSSMLEQRRDAAPVRNTVAVGSKVLLSPAFGVGISVLGDANWARFQLRVGYEFAPIDHRLQLAIVLPIGVLTGRQRDLGGFDITSTGFELTPGARLNVLLIPNLSLYVDAGLGLTAYSHGAQELGRRWSGNSAGLAIRTALGVEYRVMDLLGVYLEPIGLHFQTAESAVLEDWDRSDQSFPIQWTFLVGVNFRI